MAIYTMNVANGAVTEYRGTDAVSVATLAGRTFLAGPDGLYEFSGDTDDGTEIDALVKLGRTDFGSANTKRATDAYVEASTDGSLEFHVYTDDGEDYAYTLDDDATELVTHKADLGRGIRTRRWQFGISNVGGCDFEVTEIMVIVDGTGRR